ncbi:MAG: folylpolyglutamate synthase/dihydrofolate synthase family protein [Bacteroidota bacterium]|nr:folylpolyglutamate synthase/dihydrofolate synthase family protein [Bacteroidota bacterium]
MKSYSETLDFLYSQLPMFHRIGAAAYKNSLDNTLALDELYGSPHKKFKSIHVAGTNGKGSVSHLLASVLQEAGYKTGLYTSPHLRDFRERIKIDGVMIPEDEVVRFVDDFYKRNTDPELKPSFFEFTVAMAFDYFAREKVDVAIIETGLGGRLDSTNIIAPDVSVITNISFDHMALLGDTIPKIAAEKAGIIKEGIPVVIGETHPESAPVFIERARELSVPIYFADQINSILFSTQTAQGTQLMTVHSKVQFTPSKFEVGLLGFYQRKNVATVLTVLDVLTERGWLIRKDQIADGFKYVVRNTGLMGRWQILGQYPLVVCDTGHNEDGIRLVVEQIAMTPYNKLHFVIGMVNDKDVRHVLQLLPKDAEYYFTKASIPRALDEQELQKLAQEAGLEGACYPTVAEAFRTAKQNALEQDMVFVGGSNFIVAEVI